MMCVYFWILFSFFFFSFFLSTFFLDLLFCQSIQILKTKVQKFFLLLYNGFSDGYVSHTEDHTNYILRLDLIFKMCMHLKSHFIFIIF